jgi:phosphohistidine phosphatase
VLVFLIRHAHAVDEGDGLADADRYLSSRGRETLRKVAGKLGQEGVRFDALLTSPLVRAVQTAEILAHGVGFLESVVALPPLAPGASIARAADEIATLGADVACVGHEPSISALGALLTRQPSFPSFRPGQVTLIRDGAALWTLQPDLLEIVRLS